MVMIFLNPLILLLYSVHCSIGRYLDGELQNERGMVPCFFDYYLVNQSGSEEIRSTGFSVDLPFPCLSAFSVLLSSP